VTSDRSSEPFRSVHDLGKEPYPSDDDTLTAAESRDDSANTANSAVHLRLYDYSLKMQQAGRELREQIEKARKAPPQPAKRISPKDTEILVSRLYDQAMKKQVQTSIAAAAAAAAADIEIHEKNAFYAIDEKAAETLYGRLFDQAKKNTSAAAAAAADAAAAEVQEKTTVRTIEEKAKQELFNRLHREKMNNRKNMNKGQTKTIDDKKAVRTIKEKAKQELFSRLYGEKMKKGIAYE